MRGDTLTISIMSFDKKKEGTIRMAIGNVELMHECFPKHKSMGTRMKQDKETEEGKKRGVSMESKEGFYKI